MTFTRTLCPLCDWHHDQPEFDPTVPQPFASERAPKGVDPMVWGYSLGRTQVVGKALKAHLETHGLIEWVEAVTTAQRRIGAVDDALRNNGFEYPLGAAGVRDMAAQRGGYLEELRQAQAQVTRIRAFLEDMATWCSPHNMAASYSQRGLDALDGVDTPSRGGVLRLPDDVMPLLRQYVADEGVAGPATQASGP